MTGRHETGSATVEFAVMALGLLGIVGLLVVAGRVQIASHAVDEAARDAARETSIARTAEDARRAGRTAATTTLAKQDLQCTHTTVAIGTSQFTRPAGRPASVSARVTCRVALADLALPGIPGSRTVTATVHSPVDTYRQRTP